MAPIRVAPRGSFNANLAGASASIGFELCALVHGQEFVGVEALATGSATAQVFSHRVAEGWDGLGRAA